MNLLVSQTLRDLQVDWERVHGTSLYSEPEWISYMENRIHPTTYIAVLDDQGPAVVLPIYRVEAPASHTLDPATLFEEPDALPVLISGAISGWRGEFLIDRQLPVRTRAILLSAALQESRHLAHDRSQLIAYLIEEDDFIYAEALNALRFRRRVIGQESLLELQNVRSFDDYLATLSPDRRSAIRRERRRFSAGGGTLSCFELGSRDVDLVRPWQATERRYGKSRSKQQILRLLAEWALLPWENRVVAATKDDDIVGFALFLGPDRQGQLFARVAGSCREESDPPFTYFEALFYGAVELALQLGATRIFYGPGSLEAKEARGCSIKPLAGYFRFL